MNANSLNGFKRNYQFRAMFDYGECGQMKEYYCDVRNLDNAIEEVERFAEQYNTDPCNLKIVPSWIGERKGKNGNESCVYDFKEN